MLERLGYGMARWAQRWVPDPFVLALALTIITILCAISLGKPGFDLWSAVGSWGGRLANGELTPEEKGFWRFLTFAMQMAFILVTGHALAVTKPIARLIRRLASLPKNTGQAAALTAVVAMVSALVNWGLGLIVGALLAREVGVAFRESGRKLHYPLVAAAGYVGLMVWHGGLSGSAPLKMSQMKDVQEVLGGVTLPGGQKLAEAVGPLPLSETLFSPLNLVTCGLLLLFVPFFFWLLAPKGDQAMTGIERFQPQGEISPPEPQEKTLVAFLEQKPYLNWIAALLGITYLSLYLPKLGFWNIDINVINLCLLILGLILHPSPLSYVRAITEASRGVGGIILQFPFYAGILGILSASGLLQKISDGIVSISTATTFPFWTFLSASLVNLFVPSGGGQWGVQGPIVMLGASQLGVDYGSAVMALAYGDEWTNMLQPFWALPLLSLTGVRARDIFGYTIVVMLLSFPLYGIPLFFLS
ncbi:MAG: TIGR00366 family protein [Fimbriimonadales bacterium]|nr:TIGR00366 family protein [Fimbriimonadales bacterium]